MNELIAQLKELGLTEYEAKAYTALVQNSHVSAYQVSKNSGIPRARIYDILNGLVEKGFVLKEETADQTTYSSIPVEMFLQQIQQRWQSNFTSISDQLEKLETKEQEAEPKVLMLKGKQTILNYCQTLLKKQRQKLSYRCGRICTMPYARISKRYHSIWRCMALPYMSENIWHLSISTEPLTIRERLLHLIGLFYRLMDKK